MSDYLITSETPPPKGYPFEMWPDEFAEKSFHADYEFRRKAFLKFILRNPAPNHPKAAFYEIARLAEGKAPHEGVLAAALDFIDARQDCADFALHAILRLLYQYFEHPLVNEQLLTRAKQTVLEFKYWPDEPGQDSMCTWTENHYILFASAGYLAGQMFPKQVFTNSGFTGFKQMAYHRPRILQWLNLRFFTGFSEWLSNVYYDEDLTALLSLVDFCQDEEIRQRATMIIDLLLFDMAVNSYNGVFGSTHGRSYEQHIKWAAEESTSSTYKLLFGKGAFSTNDNMSAIAFALSTGYNLPQVLYNIANDDTTQELVNRQRVGFPVDQAPWWGIGFKDLEDGMTLLTQEAYAHPRTIHLMVKMLNRFRWWDNEYFKPFRERKTLIKALRTLQLLLLAARLYKCDLTRNTREQANLYTYRTTDYMLSSAQDYRKGYGGDQQHIWQATLGPNAVCFTTHPGRLLGPTPNYWSGSGTLPRVAQIKNVLIAIYRISRRPAIYKPNQLFFTHAWLPRDQFEQVVEEDGWIFSRLGDGYLALFSQHPYRWRDLPGEDQDREVIVEHPRNIWVCEMGRRADYGDFQQFIQLIIQAPLMFYDSKVKYTSPSLGQIEFGWKVPLKLEGHPIPLDNYPRYGNPYAQVEFPAERISISLGEHWLELDGLSGERKASSFAS